MLDVQLTSFLEAGTDEAGRGCLAGPVTASAVILPLKSNIPLLNDSKKLTEKQRYYLRPIIEKNAIAFGVAFVYQQKIDEINILNASIRAMHLALRKLKINNNETWDKILADGGSVQNLSELDDVVMAHDTPAKEVFKTFKEIDLL